MFEEALLPMEKRLWTKLLDDILELLHEHQNVLKAVAAAVAGGLVLRYTIRWWPYYKLSKLRAEKRETCRQSLRDLETRLRNTSSIDSADLSVQEDIISLSFLELSARLQDGRLAPTKVLEAYQMKALEVHNATNCLIEPIFEAEPLAVECDQKTANKGPLHGIPVSLKDNYGLKGYDSTVGCSEWINHPFPDDAVVVKVLKKQGAIPFVKTNIPQTMISFETTNPIFGATTSLLDKKCKRGVGGSSGGEGALLSGKGSILGFGSDIGGSIRIPANMNGIYGFKPTCGRLSADGTHPIYKGQTLVPSCYGPMARDVDTLVAAMKSVCVPYMYELDPTIPYQPFKQEVYETKRKLKIGFFLTSDVFESIPAMQRGVLEAKAALEKMGHQVVPWDYPDFMRVASDLYGAILLGDGGRELQTLLKYDEVDSAMRSLTTLWKIPSILRYLLLLVMRIVMPNMARTLSCASGVGSVSKWWNFATEHKKFRATIIADWKEKGIDAMISPGFACCALPFGKAEQATGTVAYTMLYNVLDFPAGSLPVSKVNSQDCRELENYPTPDLWHHAVKKGMVGSEGLPINVQVATLPWRDELCLRVMKDLETGLKL